MKKKKEKEKKKKKEKGKTSCQKCYVHTTVYIHTRAIRFLPNINLNNSILGIACFTLVPNLCLRSCTSIYGMLARNHEVEARKCISSQAIDLNGYPIFCF